MRGPNRKSIVRARKLRIGQTDVETKLWHRLRNRQIANCKFVRQEPIGRYICDFVCRESRLIVEVDGGQHFESRHDKIRDRELANDGYRVLRFWDNDVIGNIDGVLERIHSALMEELPLTPPLSP